MLHERRLIAWGALALAAAFPAACESGKSGPSGNAAGFIGSADAGAGGVDAAGAGGDGAQPMMVSMPEGGPGPGSGPPCNSDPRLCSKAFSAVTFLGTHLSMANDDTWPSPTQGRTLREQLLSGGVRALELQVHDDQGALAACAGDCSVASTSLSSVLRDISTFLTQNPTDVLTLVLRSAVASAALAQAFEDQALVPLAHTQMPGKPWPTLRQMIDDNQRLVVFVAPVPSDADAGAGAGPSAPPGWLHPLSDWAWETAPSEAVNCVIASGNAKSPLAILNQYSAGEASADAALIAAHAPEVVAARLNRCKDDRGHTPNIVFVNFAEVGDPNGGVQIANGLR
ncbi:MAG: hypothetical protein ABJB12_13335 [Pseudomonadota bacterium]